MYQNFAEEHTCLLYISNTAFQGLLVEDNIIDLLYTLLNDI